MTAKFIEVNRSGAGPELINLDHVVRIVPATYNGVNLDKARIILAKGEGALDVQETVANIVRQIENVGGFGNGQVSQADSY